MTKITDKVDPITNKINQTIALYYDIRSTNPELYFGLVELEAIDDWKFEEIEKRLIDKERIERVITKCHTSRSELSNQIQLKNKDKKWTLFAILEKDSHSMHLFLRELTADVFDNKCTLQVTITNPGGYHETTSKRSSG